MARPAADAVGADADDAEDDDEETRLTGAPAAVGRCMRAAAQPLVAVCARDKVLLALRVIATLVIPPLFNRFAHSAGPYCMIATASARARGHCGAAEEEEDEDGEGEGMRRRG